MTDSIDIEDLRNEIDQIDNSLLALFNERAQTAIKVGDQESDQ